MKAGICVKLRCVYAFWFHVKKKKSELIEEIYKPYFRNFHCTYGKIIWVFIACFTLCRRFLKHVRHFEENIGYESLYVNYSQKSHFSSVTDTADNIKLDRNWLEETNVMIEFLSHNKLFQLLVDKCKIFFVFTFFS